MSGTMSLLVKDEAYPTRGGDYVSFQSKEQANEQTLRQLQAEHSKLQEKYRKLQEKYEKLDDEYDELWRAHHDPWY